MVGANGSQERLQVMTCPRREQDVSLYLGARRHASSRRASEYELAPANRATRVRLCRAVLQDHSAKEPELVRVALVFSRRGYNIESLVVSPGKDPGYSRMTITCSGAPATLEQIIKQLAKLIDVVHAIDHTGGAVYETEIALLKIESKA